MFNVEKRVRNFVIGVKILLYIVVSIISTIHVIDFFVLTNPYWLAVSLAIAFEIGAAASLAAILVLPKAKQSMVWIIFMLLTLTQAMGNMYFAYENATNYESWMELFGLTNFTVIEQKRILSIVSGAILPVIALGFIKSLVDYLKPDDGQTIIKELKDEPEVVEEKPKELIKEVIKEEPKEVIKEVIKEEPKEIIKEEPKEEPKEIIKDVIKEEPKEIIKEVIKEEPKEEPKEIIKEEPKEEPKEVIKEEPKEIIKDEVKKLDKNPQVFPGIL